MFYRIVTNICNLTPLTGAEYALKVPKEVVLEIVGRLGKATSKQVWMQLFSQGYRCKRKTVSVMLLRCSRQGLLRKTRLDGRSFVYWLSDAGKSRLEYRIPHPNLEFSVRHHLERKELVVYKRSSTSPSVQRNRLCPFN